MNSGLRWSCKKSGGRMLTEDVPSGKKNSKRRGQNAFGDPQGFKYLIGRSFQGVDVIHSFHGFDQEFRLFTECLEDFES